MAAATASTSEMLASVRANAGNDGAIESAEWMNQIVAQLWPFISTFIQNTLKADVEPLVNAQVPAWLGSVTFDKVSLGSTPLRIEGLDVISTGPAGTRLEADIYYDGDAAVSIDVVTKLLGTLSLGVQHIKLAGTIQFVMSPLVPVLPLMAATQLAFVNRPTLAMDLTGLADIDQAASIKATISNTILDVLCGLLVLPNRVAAKVDPAADYFEVRTQWWMRLCEGGDAYGDRRRRLSCLHSVLPPVEHGPTPFLSVWFLWLTGIVPRRLHSAFNCFPHLCPRVLRLPSWVHVSLPSVALPFET